MTDAFFRASVGACIFDARGRILVLRRRSPPEAWQMPQGGIHIGETPLAALYREIQEETALEGRDIEVAGEVGEWLVYQLPETDRNAKVGWGQAQRWFLCRLLSTSAEPRPDQVEFTQFEWVSPEELLRRAVEFRRTIYTRVIKALAAVEDASR